MGAVGAMLKRLERLIFSSNILRNIQFESSVFTKMSLYLQVFGANLKICTLSFEILTRSLFNGAIVTFS